MSGVGRERSRRRKGSEKKEEKEEKEEKMRRGRLGEVKGKRNSYTKNTTTTLRLKRMIVKRRIAIR